MSSVAAGNEIREFLTTRRARITPDQAGLRAVGNRRRVTGLRLTRRHRKRYVGWRTGGSRVRPGDVHVTGRAEEHWHGAAHVHFMTHLSITRGSATWGEHVTDGEYGRRVD